MTSLEELNLKLMLAQKDNLLVKVLYFNDREIEEVTGYVDTINYVDQYIIIYRKKLALNDIIELVIL